MDNVFGRALLNGWQLSGISSLASGIPDPAELHRRRGAATHRRPPTSAPPTSSDRATPAATGWRRSTPAIRVSAATDVGEKLLDINCISVPAFGENGELVPPYNIRTPTRTNHDLTLFKNFEITGDQKLQFRVGFFNIFNQAFANTHIGGDINLTLDTSCRVRVPGVPNGDRRHRPTSAIRRSGFDYTPQTIDNFGKINLKRGHRVIEFVLKYYF